VTVWACNALPANNAKVNRGAAVIIFCI
jgi:hypothetical protein